MSKEVIDSTNLREFRIDSASSETAGPSSFNISKENLYPVEQISNTPNKEQSSVQENKIRQSIIPTSYKTPTVKASSKSTPPSQREDIDDLWKKWNEEFDHDTKKQNPQTKKAVEYSDEDIVFFDADLEDHQNTPSNEPKKTTQMPEAISLKKATNAHIEMNPQKQEIVESKNIEIPTEQNEEQLAPATEEPTENNYSRQWLTELAYSERRMEKTGEVDYTNHFQKPVILKARTTEFLQILKKAFQSAVEDFNESRNSVTHSIRVYKISGTENDFMIFRNGIKLIISGQQAGLIQFVFNQYLGHIFAPSQKPMIEIEATWGAFDQLHWTFKGQRVEHSEIVRYFLTEFIHQSSK